jgi:hypothetical protein
MEKHQGNVDMEITGSDYTFLTNIGPEFVEPLFVKKIESCWVLPIIEEFERTNDELELFFAKDAEMNRLHEENGFSLGQDGQGCFMFCAERFRLLQCDAKLFNVASPDDMEGRTRSRTFLTNVWEYSLVLPDLIEDSPFSQKIHGYLMEAISEACKLG